MWVVAVFAVGWIIGAVTIAALVGTAIVDRDIEVWDEATRDPSGPVPPYRARRPVDDRRRHHPAMRARRNERGGTDVDTMLVAGIVAGLVLVAPTLRWWIIPAALLAAVLLAGALLVEES